MAGTSARERRHRFAPASLRVAWHGRVARGTGADSVAGAGTAGTRAIRVCSCRPGARSCHLFLRPHAQRLRAIRRQGGAMSPVRANRQNSGPAVGVAGGRLEAGPCSCRAEFSRRPVHPFRLRLRAKVQGARDPRRPKRNVSAMRGKGHRAAEPRQPVDRDGGSPLRPHPATERVTCV